MRYHHIYLNVDDSVKSTESISNILFNAGFVAAGADEGEGVLTISVSPPADGWTPVYVSDPLFENIEALSNPNDFFIPLSKKLGNSPLFIIDLDEDDILQYWIFRNGECVDQYNSEWKLLPQEEQKNVSGKPETLSSVFSDMDAGAWKNWLEMSGSGHEKYYRLGEMTQLSGWNVTYENTSKDNKALRFKYVRELSPAFAGPKHLFPWILFAVPAAYFSLRYQSTPEFVPAPHTPDNNENLPRWHKYLIENVFAFYGDYFVNLIKGVQIFLRIYYKASDSLHVIIGRTQTPVDALWHIEVASHFTDGTEFITTNAAGDPHLPIPNRTIFWLPKIENIDELIKSHIENSEKHINGRELKFYSEDTYLLELQKNIKNDYELLRKSGFLRYCRNDTYGLSLKGAVKMLYGQWKSIQQI